MTPELWQRVKQAWEQYQQLPDEQRPSFLQQLRVEDTDVASELETLMRRHEASGPAPRQAPPVELQDDVAQAKDTPAKANPATIDYIPQDQAGEAGQFDSTADPVSAKSSIQARPPQQSATPSFSETWPSHAGRYVIQEMIAQGGMGAVLRAVDPDIQRTLAVKIMLPKAQSDPDSQRRFLDEARITGQLQHPGIPPIHELGTLDNGCPFFAMKLIEGRSLADLLKQRPDAAHELPRFLGIFEQICQTLGYAHSRAIIHRDLKPHNIMVGAFGEVQVMDWGLAKQLGSEEPQSWSRGVEFETQATEGSVRAGTQTGVAMGTPAYMAPEQACGEITELDKRCDVFGLGAILCQILTGKPPFQGTKKLGVLRQAADGNLADAIARLDGCGADAELIALTKTCLAPDKEDRPNDGGEVATAVAVYQEGVQEKLRQTELDKAQAQVKSIEESRRRKWILIATAAIVLLVIAAASGGLFYQSYQLVRQERGKYLEKEIASAIESVRTARKDLYDDLAKPKEYHKYMSDMTKWRAKLNAAKAAYLRAKKLVDSDKEALVSADIRQQVQALTNALQQDESYWQGSQKFDKIREQAYILTPEGIDQSVASPRLLDAFKVHLKVDMKSDPEKKIVKKLAKLSHALVLAATLDFWAIITKDDPLQARLLRIAGQVDNNPLKNQIRNKANWRRATLETLVQQVQPEQHSPQFLWMLATLLGNAGGNEAAFLRSVMVHHPRDFWLHFEFGGAVSETGEEMEGCYKAAAAIRPGSEIAHNGWGIALEEQGDYDGALEHYRLAIKIAPRFAVAVCNAGSAFYKKRDYDRALTYYTKARDIDPNLAFAHCNIGAVFSKKGKYDVAITHFKKALDCNRNFAVAHMNWGFALRLKDDYDGAIYHYRKALELEHKLRTSQRFLLHINLGVAFRKKADYETALMHFEKARDLFPVGHGNRQTAFHNIQRTLQAVGQTQPSTHSLIGELTATDPLDNFPMTKKCWHKVHLVELQAKKTYQIDLTGQFDTFLRIEDTQKKPLLYNDDLTPPKVRHSRLIFQPKKTGQYRLIVTSYKPATGAYTLKWQEVKPFAAAKVFNGKLTKEDHSSRGSFMKIYNIKLKAGRAYTFEVESQQFDTFLALGGSAGKRPLTQNDDIVPGNTRISRIDFTPEETGVYRVAVTSYGAGETGNFTLTMQEFAHVPAKKSNE